MRLFSRGGRSRSSSSSGAEAQVPNVNSASEAGVGASAGANVLLGGRRGLGGVTSVGMSRTTRAVARKMDEAPSRPSGSPLKNTESAFSRIAKRLSLGSGKRKSLTGATKALKDLERSPGAASIASSSTATSAGSNATAVAVAANMAPALPKEVAIPVKMVTEAELEEERNKLIKDLGADTALIVSRVAAEFTPKQSDVISISSMSHTTMKFCGRSAPPVSLSLYLSRLIRNINNALDEGAENHPDSVGVRCLLIAVLYIQRMKEKQPDFEINALNVHRLFFVAMTDALKVNEDEHPDNKYMALVGGVDTLQLNTLEAAFCTSSDFNFIVTMDQLESLYHKYYKTTHTLVAPKNHEKYPVRRVSWESRN